MQKNKLRLALYQPEIALNVGSIIRLCSCFKIDLDIIEPCGFPFSIKALKRSSLDYYKTCNINKYLNYEDFFQTRIIKFSDKINKSKLILMSTKAQKTLWDYNFNENDIIIMGNESSGVSNEVHSDADEVLKIPISNECRSLNLSISAGISVAEALRQLNNDN